MSPDRAQTIALQALAWLVANDDLCPTFMGATGTSIDDLRNRVGEVEFQTSVLDFLTMDDAWVMAFCDDAGLPYEDPLTARYALPGQGQVHWT